MESIQIADLAQVSVAAVIIVVILRLIFNFLEKRTNALSASKADPVCSFNAEEKQMLRTIAIQVAEVHTTLQVTREFQKAFEAIVESQSQQTKILKELSHLNSRTLKFMQHIAEDKLNINFEGE